MKQISIAVVLIAIGSVLAHLYVVSQNYYPVARVSSPDGLVFTAVQDATPDRKACGAANDRFLNPVRQPCTQCKVVLARCERELEPFELNVAEGRTITHPVVSAHGLRIAVEGPREAAKASCELMAGALRKSGMGVATCLQPPAEKQKAP